MRNFNGPLRVCPANPRYFTDDGGKPIYLTGSHTWTVLQDRGVTNPPPAYDYTGFLDMMQNYNHNFMRFWAIETSACQGKDPKDPTFTDPMPYEATGPGTAFDGRPKFDLTRFNQAYFDRLRARVIQAGERGIYCAVMLFQGFSVDAKGSLSNRNPWVGHPFHRDNNINGIDGDPENTGEGKKTHTLDIREITNIQKAYVRKVIDTVNDLDNVLYEISNESGDYSCQWQYEMIRYVKEYESCKPVVHPVLMTYFFPGGNNEALFNSAADAISPSGSHKGIEWALVPPAADGSKVLLPDTDHIWGMGGSSTWVWKCFVSGSNPIFMDFYPEQRAPMHNHAGWGDDWAEPARRAMGDTRKLSQRINLAGMVPFSQASSTRYCLAQPGVEYVVYQPEVGPFDVYLEGAAGTFSFEWFDPNTSKTIEGGTVEGGRFIYFQPPFRGDCVLHLKKTASS